MLGDNALPAKPAEADSSPPSIAQPDHLAADPTAILAPDDPPKLVLPPRSPVASEDTDFLSPLFTEIAISLDYDFREDLTGSILREDLSWVPNVLMLIIDSILSPDHKQHWLKFFLRYISIIIMVKFIDPSALAVNYGTFVPDDDTLTKEIIFASLLSELTPSIATKGSEYVNYRDYYTGYESEPGEDVLAATIYESLAKYLAQFVKLPNDH